jgi:hypothetical protein
MASSNATDLAKVLIPAPFNFFRMLIDLLKNQPQIGGRETEIFS